MGAAKTFTSTDNIESVLTVKLNMVKIRGVLISSPWNKKFLLVWFKRIKSIDNFTD